MRLPLHQIDAFASRLFEGNPAAVVPLEAWIPDALMQDIARENNLSETVFAVPVGERRHALRWFSPLREIPFCGHATLACAHHFFEKDASLKEVVFEAPAVGAMPVRKLSDGRIEMSFPRREAVVVPVPDDLIAALGLVPLEVLANDQAYLAVLETEEQVRALRPDMALLASLGPRDVVVTAPGTSHDFVSRYFWPANGGDEDPVTGSIHTALAPYWADRLGKSELLALQASARTGVLHCRLHDNRVFLSGHARTYLHGTIELEST
jgi:PhzF family phenazine biosynthesis protein